MADTLCMGQGLLDALSAYACTLLQGKMSCKCVSSQPHWQIRHGSSACESDLHRTKQLACLAVLRCARPHTAPSSRAACASECGTCSNFHQIQQQARRCLEESAIDRRRSCSRSLWCQQADQILDALLTQKLHFSSSPGSAYELRTEGTLHVWNGLRC